MTCSGRASCGARQPHSTPVRLASERAHAGFTFGYNLPLPAERVQDVLTAIAFARNRVGANGRVLLLGLGTRGRVGCGSTGAVTALTWIARCLTSRASGSPGWTASTRPDFLPGAAKYGDVPALLALSSPRELWLREMADEARGSPGHRHRRATGRRMPRRSFTIAASGATIDDGIAWAVR